MATTGISHTPSDPMIAKYRLVLMGSFALQRPDGSLVLGLGRKARALIAIVAMAKAPVERTRLAELLWSDRGRDQARASLRQTLYELRQQLPSEPPLLVVGPDSVAIAHSSAVIDVEAGDALSGELHSEHLLRDLEHVDPRFDQWLMEERSRLAAANGHERDLALPFRELADGQSGGGRPESRRLVAPASPSQATRLWFAVGALVCIVGAIGLIASRPRNGSEPNRVVNVQLLATTPEDTPARALADGLALAVERNVVGTETPVRIADASSSAITRPDLILRGNATSRGGRLLANLALVAADNTVIWSGTYDRPPGEAGAMIDQLGLQVARELHFAFANGRNALFDHDPEAIRLSLAAGDAVGRDFGEAARYSTQLLVRAPGFARGWAESAVNAVEAAQDLPERARATVDTAADVDARRAIAIDSHQGLAYFALVESRSGLAQWSQREQIISRGLAEDPASPELNVARADDLATIGRIQEAVGYAQRAFALDHFLPGKVAVLARMYMDVGDVDAARAMIARGRRMWPGQRWPDALAFELAMYWGDPAEARTLLDAGRLPWRQPRREADLAFLAWRTAPSEATATDAARAIQATGRRVGAEAELVQQLAALGRINAAYSLAATLPSVSEGDSRWYRDYLAPFRADPRFMIFAAKQGVASIWRSTGLWPDFCTDQALRYRCIVPATGT